MAKKLLRVVKLQLEAGKATPAPPVGPALGQYGVNLMEFILFFFSPRKKRKETPPHIAAHFQAPTSQRPNQRLVKELQFCLHTRAELLLLSY